MRACYDDFRAFAVSGSRRPAGAQPPASPPSFSECMLIFIDGRQRPEHVPWTNVEQVDFDRPPAM